PTLSRVAALWHRDAPVGPYVKETQDAAQALGLQLQALEVGGPEAWEQAFAAMTREHADALVVLPSGQIESHQRVVADLAMDKRGQAHRPRGPSRTTACSRRPPASAPLRLPGAAEAQRSVLRRLGLGLRHLGGEGETRQPGGPRVDRGGHVAAAQGGGGRARG